MHRASPLHAAMERKTLWDRRLRDVAIFVNAFCKEHALAQE